MPGIDGSARIVFVRCVCGKLHATGGMRMDSVCVCNRYVNPLRLDYGKRSPIVTIRHDSRKAN